MFTKLTKVKCPYEMVSFSGCLYCLHEDKTNPYCKKDHCPMPKDDKKEYEHEKSKRT